MYKEEIISKLVELHNLFDCDLGNDPLCIARRNYLKKLGEIKKQEGLEMVKSKN